CRRSGSTATANGTSRRRRGSCRISHVSRRRSMSSPPPDGLNVRRATLDDFAAINELITAADVAVQGWSESSEGELLGWWRMMELDANSWVLYGDGAIAAYAVGFVHGDELEVDGFVRPVSQGGGP